MRNRRVRASLGAGLLFASLALGSAVTLGAPAASASGGPLLGNGSVDEAWLTGATPGDAITLLQNGTPVVNAANPGTADSLGSLIIRNLTPGDNYTWDDTTSSAEVAPFSVLAPGDNPPTDSALYTGQPMHDGLNYITMRDGIQLAATVRYPNSTTCTASAPCPTVIEYSGYGTAAPTDPIPFVLAQAEGTTCTDCGDPNLLPDSSTEVGSVVARMVGFATVSLQMRGTGCSGGAYDLLGYPSDYDAYDAIEIVAHQDWVANHKVGMVGISYSGLSQLPAAGTDPPDLAAIAPLSPTDDLFSTGYPGGIYNSGFAAEWISQRIDDAMPAATYSGGQLVPLSSTPVTNVAQPWTYYEIDAEMAASDSSTCLANQALHEQSEDLSSLVGPQMVAPGTGPGRDASLFTPRSMTDWAPKITVPVFISGALEDDQTGPQWPALLDALPSSGVYANMVNGGHIDSADPQVMSRWLEFLDIYVADKVPTDPGLFGDVVLDEFASSASGTSGQAALPAFRFTTAKTLVKAETDFAKKTPRVEVFFDSGASTAGAGNPGSSYQAKYTTWPPKGKVETYYFGADGSLNTKAPKTSGNTSLVLDPSVRPQTDLPPGDNPWAAAPPWDWTPVPAADGVAFQTAPFTKDTTFVGPATVDLWVESGTPVDDFQVTVTEVRPSADPPVEEYVTSGFLRSSNQVELSNSTSLFTDPSYLAADAVSLSPTSYELVRIPVDPIAHTFRPGTELRIVISAPGGDRPLWEFDTVDSGQSATVGFGGVAASTLVINKAGGVKPPAALPSCGSVQEVDGSVQGGSLRGEPCRLYQAEGNQTPSGGAQVASARHGHKTHKG
jgi:predicted acyl esterase